MVPENPESVKNALVTTSRIVLTESAFTSIFFSFHENNNKSNNSNNNNKEVSSETSVYGLHLKH